MKRELIVVAAAVFMGIAAVAFYEMRLAAVEKELKAQLKEKEKVCALKRSIGARHLLTPDLLKTEEVPRAYLHPKAVKWSNRAEIIGQRVLFPMQANQVILWSDLQEHSRRSVDDSIPPGRAVVTIPIDMVGGVSGLITPGARVDLFGIFKRLDFGERKQRTEGEGEDAGKVKTKKQIRSIDELNAMLDQFDQFAGALSGQPGSGFYVLPIASNLGVFSVGANTQSNGDNPNQKGYSTISFDVPLRTQVLLIMAMHKVDTEGGRLVCVLRSSQAGGEALEKPGQVFRSDEFLKLIPQAYAEIQNNR